MKEEKVLPIAEALYRGGIRFIEVTFDLKSPENFAATTRAIRSISDRFGSDMLAGAGTVVSAELVEMACDAGALYIISPNTDESVIRRTKEKGMVSIPGALTPSECLIAHNAGADFIKLFPAGELGAGYIKALAAPLGHLRLLAVGGVNEKNIPDFLKAGVIGFGIGSELTNKAWIEAGEFQKITELAKRYVQAVK